MPKHKGKRRKYADAWWHLSWMNEHVRQHNFDAVGDRSYQCWDSGEVMLFNPSKCIPLAAHMMIINKFEHGDPFDVSLSEPVGIEELKQISDEAKKEYKRLVEED